MNLKAIERNLKKHFSRQRKVVLAYIFGSSLKKRREAHDVDIAVLLDKRPPDDALIKARTSIILEMRKILPGVIIDISILNGASVTFCHEVIKNGKILYEKDQDTRVDFETASDLKFYDLEPFRKFFWQHRVAQIREGKFIG